MRRILSAFLFIYGFLAVLVGIINYEWIFFLGLVCCFVAWMVYPKKKKEKDDKGKSYRDNRTWED